MQIATHKSINKMDIGISANFRFGARIADCRFSSAPFDSPDFQAENALLMNRSGLSGSDLSRHVLANLADGSALATSRRTTWSFWTTANIEPSGENASSRAGMSNVIRSWPVATSHRRTDPSSLAVARMALSGLKATAVVLNEWPRRCAAQIQVARPFGDSEQRNIAAVHASCQ